MKVSPFAGKPPETGTLVNVPKLITAYYTAVPDASVPAQRIAFGTSGSIARFVRVLHSPRHKPGTRESSISGLVTLDTPSVTRTSENRVVVSSCAAVTEKLGTDSGKFPDFGERERNGGDFGAGEGKNGCTSFPALVAPSAAHLRETA